MRISKGNTLPRAKATSGSIIRNRAGHETHNINTTTTLKDAGVKVKPGMVRRGVAMRSARFYQSVEVWAQVDLPTEITPESIRATGEKCWEMAKELAKEAFDEAEDFLPTEDGGSHGFIR